MYMSVSGRATFVVLAQGAKMASAGPGQKHYYKTNFLSSRLTDKNFLPYLKFEGGKFIMSSI